MDKKNIVDGDKRVPPAADDIPVSAPTIPISLFGQISSDWIKMNEFCRAVHVCPFIVCDPGAPTSGRSAMPEAGVLCLRHLLERRLLCYDAGALKTNNGSQPETGGMMTKTLFLATCAHRSVLATTVLVILAVLSAVPAQADADSPFPLQPPDTTSPRATISTFLNSINEAWEFYDAGDPAYREVFLRAKRCLDLSEVPPLVFDEVSANHALVLKEILDRIELPPPARMPGQTEIEAEELTRWSIPHTEITVVRMEDGHRQGEWLFSADTVARASDFYSRVKHLPYRPGKLGGHVDELRFGTDFALFNRLVVNLPAWTKRDIGGLLIWQWVVLGLLLVALALLGAVAAWIGRRWSRKRSAPGAGPGTYLLPLALLAMPFVGGTLIYRLFLIPTGPVLWVKLALSVVGYVGLAWVIALGLSRIATLVVGLGFRDARPLKQQLVRVIFRIATIMIVTGLAIKAAQSLGVPVAGLIAGVGVGGLAIALAAQGTLENFIGGIILYADQPVKVGDLCKFGDRRGVVEDVGLRSVKIRTVDRTVVTVPNADFAKLQLENLSERDQILMRETICLWYETTRDQLCQVLSGLESALTDHPQVADEPLRVRFTGFGQHFLSVELFAYALTSSYPEYLKIREGVFMDAMHIIEKAGTRLALPTEIHVIGKAMPNGAEKPA